jgi:UDP:flavonoid glycosyltransferase YjiC (YdhE family)
MRFLFTTAPMIGHFHPMVPLALSLKEHGHEVAFATGKGFGPVVRRTGFQHFPCGLDFDGSKDIFEVLPEWEAIKAKSPADMGLQQLYGFVQGLAPRMADDLIGLVDTWKPGVIVRDPLEFGAYIAAEHYGVPHATIIWATYISAKALCPEAILGLRRRYGLPDDAELDTLDRYLVLDFLPSSWTFPHLPYPPVAYRFCAPPFDLSSGGRLPDWMETLPDQPTVYATLGTTFNQSPATFRSILTALSTEAVNLIMTVGWSMDPKQFGPQPDYIKIEQYIPQTLLLPHCDALIFHGGYNSLLSALWHGLPMVIAPVGAGDQWATGWRCADVGAGVLVEGNPPTAEAMRAAVKTVLGQPGYRARAQELQREIKELPSLAKAVKRLEILSKDRVPQFNDHPPGT